MNKSGRNFPRRHSSSESMTFFAHFSGIWYVYQKGGTYTMALIKSVSRTEPCPICGKPDYCFWKEREKEPDMYNLYCNRSSEAPGVIVTGVDGIEYISIFEQSRGTIYESVVQREERKKERVTGKKKERSPRQFTILDSIMPLPNEQLDTIYRSLMRHLPLYKFHAQYLLNEGWNMELIRQHQICSFPAEWKNQLPQSLKKIPSRENLATDIMNELSLKSLAGVPGAYINEKGQWTFCGKSGIVFPVYDENGFIHRLRIRLDYVDLPVKILEDDKGFYYMDHSERITVSMSGPYKTVEDKRIYISFKSHEGKYRNFSSYKQDKEAYKSGFIQNIFNKGCEAKNQLVYAMNQTDDFRVFWLIEGEKKAFLSNYIVKQPFVCIPGVSDFGKLFTPTNGKTPIDIIRQKGCRIVIIAYDADKYHNDAVMTSLIKLAQAIKKEGLLTIIADWNELNGKGLDDLFSSFCLPAFYEYN